MQNTIRTASYFNLRPKMHQKGESLVYWLTLMAIGAFFLIIILKLFPVYYENYSIKTSLKSLQEVPNIQRMSKRKVRELLFKRLQVNQVSSVDHKNVKVSNDRDPRSIEVIYQVQIPLFANVDVLVKFSDSVEVYQ